MDWSQVLFFAKWTVEFRSGKTVYFSKRKDLNIPLIFFLTPDILFHREVKIHGKAIH